MKKCIHTLLRFSYLLLLGFTPLLSQELHLSFHHLSQSDGLSEGVNSYVYKDSRGFVWISSLEGLNRFDGKSVKVYKRHPDEINSLAGNLVSSNFFEDPAGNIWFTVHEAVQCYRRASDDFATYWLVDERGDTIREDYYGFHLDTQGALWIRTGLGEKGRLHLMDIATGRDSLLCPLNGHRCSVITGADGSVSQVVSSLFPENQAGLEIVSMTPGFPKQVYFREEWGDLPLIFPKNIYVESDSLLWLGSTNGLVAFNPQTLSVRFYNQMGEQQFRRAWSIIPYGEQFLLVASYRNGIWLFDKIQRKFIQQIKHIPGITTSLRDDVVRELYLDDQQNLWVSLWSYGLDYANLRKNKFQALLTKKNLEEKATHVFAIQESPRGQILCGTGRGKGLFIFDQQKRLLTNLRHQADQPKSLSPYSIRQIFRDQEDRLWVLSHFQLQLFDEEAQTFQSVPYPMQQFNYMYQLASGRILVASYAGILELLPQGDSFQLIPCPELDQLSGDVSSIYQDQNGTVYFSENGESLQLYREEGAKLVFQQRISGLGNCWSYYDQAQDSTLWIASSYGLYKMNKYQPESHEVLTEQRGGLPIGNYNGILADSSGNFWLSSNNGLLRYHPEKEDYHRYTLGDGLQGNEFNLNAYFQSSTGEMWFGGLNGLNVFHPERIEPIPYEPSIQFNRLMVNDEPYAIASSLDDLQQLDLSYQNNTVSFDFVALEYSDANANQFKYQMQGIDDDWVDSGNRGFARYPNLRPGSYTFRVMAANSDEVWNKEARTVNIRIRAPYWQTWWFILSCLTVIAGIIYALFQYRLQQALKIERMRVKISSDLHDDVGTLLSGLAMQTEILEIKAPVEDKPRLQRISELSRSAMSRMRDTVWAIDARKDKMENLLDRMREHAEETLTPAEIRFDIQTQQIDLKKNLPTQIRQNLYLIYKEAITNIAKHSNASQVKVILQNGKSDFTMSIQDNGNLPQKNYKTTGLGLSNIKMRAEQIDAQIEIRTENGFGIYLNRKAFS